MDRPSPPSFAAAFKFWNRKFHYYLGLYLLFFTWLFAFTGLLLNHPQWTFAEFWSSRRQATNDFAITVPGPGNDLAQARDLLRQLRLTGEIEWTETRNDTNRFDFRVSRPGHIYEIKAHLAQKRATVQQIDLNLWGIMRILHVFTGVRLEDPRNSRDWFLTSVWALAMDGVAAGLILMVLSSLVMWFELRQKRLLGLLFLAAGVLSGALFCFGLRWLF